MKTNETNKVCTGNDVLFDTVHYHRQVNHEIECDKLVTESKCNYNYLQLFILQDLNGSRCLEFNTFQKFFKLLR